MRIEGNHIVAFGLGVVVGWLVVPMILGLFSGGMSGKKTG